MLTTRPFLFSLNPRKPNLETMTPNPRNPTLNDLSSRFFPLISFTRIQSLIPPWNPSDSENPPISHLSPLAGLTVNGLGLLLRPGRSLTWKVPDVDKLAKEWSRVLGDPLTEDEVSQLVERYLHNDCSWQINLGDEI
uniref:Uncharacterized protein n=1 Tax=Cannabis sativa TaxID=3483 RepID=A0A803QJS3_CANSA